MATPKVHSGEDKITASTTPKYPFLEHEMLWIHEWHNRDLARFVTMAREAKAMAQSLVAAMTTATKPSVPDALGAGEDHTKNSNCDHHLSHNENPAQTEGGVAEQQQQQQQQERGTQEAALRGDDTLTAKLHALVRGWHYLWTVILKDHQEQEETIAFPTVKQLCPNGVADQPLEIIRRLHHELDTKKDAVIAAVAELDKIHAHDLVPADLAPLAELCARLEFAAAEYAAEYKRHTDEEEKVARALLTTHVPPEQQQKLGARMAATTSASPAGKLALMMMKEVTRGDPAAAAEYRALIPAFVRWVVTPWHSFWDAGCREYWSLFHSC